MRDSPLGSRRHRGAVRARWLRPSRRRPRRRPGRPDGRLPARPAGPTRHRLRGRGPGRRHRQDRGARRLPLRPRRPPLLHQVQGSRRPLARGDEARSSSSARACRASTGTASSSTTRSTAWTWSRSSARSSSSAPALSYLWAAIKPKGKRGEPRAVGLQPLRQAALPALLQDLHREGVGRPDDRAARRVGGPADQGPVVLLRRQGRVLRQQGQQDQVADQRVPLPALRPGPDVGDDGRRDHRRAAARCG